MGENSPNPVTLDSQRKRNSEKEKFVNLPRSKNAYTNAKNASTRVLSLKIVGKEMSQSVLSDGDAKVSTTALNLNLVFQIFSTLHSN
jgi:hypothetical protein